eukprot:TRINITY_DN4624_c0_g1_i2.p1 TRINITY_DN4624_c0_g1~~TRINITY_DN4624_c0_g1_i2.p1  ORF type:complete len:370 (-),score=71.12 TRINITY_DN4624_c0_g1_i2:51-1160(-)
MLQNNRLGTRYPGIRNHFKELIEKKYAGLDTTFQGYPNDDVKEDFNSYIKAFDDMKPGDVITIFTPDNTHFPIAKEAVKRGIHVLLAKPPVQTLADHIELVKLAAEKNVLVAVELHKRWDPCYHDARERIKHLGDLNYYYSYMSQPKFQLDTFRSWAGKSSDISYYLNSHHVDILCWVVGNKSQPISVTARGSYGVAENYLKNGAEKIEDTITLLVDWKNQDGKSAHSVHTSSWIIPKTDVHSQQFFHYLGSKGEVRIDQAHRGYSTASDDSQLISVNPLYMNYAPDSRGRFAGQQGYGYRSVESFVAAAIEINEGRATVKDYEDGLALISQTLTLTAILEAGRRSLDSNRTQQIVYNKDGHPTDIVGI